MSQKKNDHYLLGLGLLAAASALCLKGLERVEETLKARREKEKQNEDRR